MKSRTDFVRMLALLAAGAAAKPEQIKAFEQYYNVNTPALGEPLVAIDEISISGLARGSSPVKIVFKQENALELTAGLNAFGGVYFWRAGPDGKIVTLPNNFRWEIENVSDQWVSENLDGHIRYIDQSGVRCTRRITAAKGKLIA